jgi:hypothetical protein
LPKKITKLETKSLTIDQQLNIIEDIREGLTDFALEKLNNNLKKNPDFDRFISKNNSLEFKLKTLYAPLVSVDVERSFSTYKHILSDRRYNLLETNIEKYIVLQFNQSL